MLTEIYIILSTTSCLHCLGVIFDPFFPRKLSSNLKGFRVWTWIFSSFQRFINGFKAGPFHKMHFLSPIENFLSVCLGIVLHCLPLFYMQHHGWWQQVKDVLVHHSIYPPFSYMKSAKFEHDHMLQKTIPTIVFPPPNLVGMVFLRCHFSSSSTMCAVRSREFNFGLIWQDYVHPVDHWLV